MQDDLDYDDLPLSSSHDDGSDEEAVERNSDDARRPSPGNHIDLEEYLAEDGLEIVYDDEQFGKNCCQRMQPCIDYLKNIRRKRVMVLLVILAIVLFLVGALSLGLGLGLGLGLHNDDGSKSSGSKHHNQAPTPSAGGDGDA